MSKPDTSGSSTLDALWHADREPDFVNDEGTKWWLHKHLTEYAQKPDDYGVFLKVGVWATECADGEKNFVVTNEEREIAYISQQYEAVAVWIDCRKMAKRPEEKECP